MSNFLGTKRLLKKLEVEGQNYYLIAFYCPACENWHHYNIGKPPDGRPSWSYNDDPDCPTFNPSLRYLTDPKCHLTITNGKIHYHSDSPKMANQTIDMVPFPEDW